MVWGPAEAVTAAVARHGAVMAVYEAEHKLPPRMSGLAAAGRRELRARRRRLSLADTTSVPFPGSGGLDDGGPAAGTSGQPYGRTPAATAPLNHVRTWSEADPSRSRRLLSESDPIASALPLYGVAVRLVSALTPEARRTLPRQWATSLARVLGWPSPGDPCWPRTDDSSLASAALPWLHVYLCEQDLAGGLSWLAGQAEAVWVDWVFRAVPANAVAGWTLQTGDLTKQQADHPTAQLKPYWRAGLLGSREVVMVADTGLDMGQCYFVDDDYSPTALRGMLRDTPAGLRWLAPDHRKVVQYVTSRNDSRYYGDGARGHGTHVAGSVAGAILGANGSEAQFQLDRGTGSAPMARLSIVDGAIDASTGLQFAKPYDTMFYAPHEEKGVRISSNSWTYDTPSASGYGYDSESFDRYLWKNPHMLHVHAAGNRAYGGEPLRAISDGPYAKNVLTIGAVENYAAADRTPADSVVFSYWDEAGQRQTAAVPVGWIGSRFDRWVYDLDSKTDGVPVVLAEPLSACSALTDGANATRFTGAVVLVDLAQGDCGVGSRATAAADAGVLAVLFVRNDERYADDTSFAGLPGTNATAWPKLSTVLHTTVSQWQGEWIRSVLAWPDAADLRMEYRWHYLTPDTVAEFSSNGPTLDGRYKPDLMAPGTNIRSARSSAGVVEADTSSCSSQTWISIGTSMSTPLVAGDLTLMRQYLREGFYPAGSQGPLSANFTPSGMLLKAVAIAGAKSLQGAYASNMAQTMGPGPDGLQGWGRLDLAGSLPLPGLTPDGMALQVADGGTIAEGQTITLNGLRSTGGSLTVVLTWYDFPAAVNSAKHLVNDLDLFYSVNGNKTKLFTLGDPANATSPDRTNPVERVQLSLSAGDSITLHVVGHKLGSRLLSADPDAALPQRWALAVVGSFTGTLQTPLNPAFVQPQRLPAFTRQSLLPLSHTLGLRGGLCLAVKGSTAIAAAGCASGLNTTFQIVEEGVPFTRIALGSEAGLCLAVRNASQPGDALQLQPCGTGSAQAFYLEGVPGASSYRLKTTTGQCVGVSSASTAAGAALTAADCLPERADHQRFALTEFPNGYWAVAPKHSPGMCLAAASLAAGAVLVTAGCSPASTGAQRFRLLDVPAPGVPSSQGYRYVVRESVSGQCLTVAGSSSGSAATLAACDGSSAQRMLVFRNPYSADTNAFQLVPLPTFNKNSTSGRLCLQHTAIGRPLSLAACDADVAEQTITVVEAPPQLRFTLQWRLPPSLAATSIQAALSPDWCLDAGSASYGIVPRLAACADGPSQQYTFSTVETDFGRGPSFSVAVGSGEFCLSAPDPVGSVRLAYCEDTEPSQAFVLRNAGVGWQLATVADVSRCMTASGTADGAALVLAACSATTAAHFFRLPDKLFALGSNGNAATLYDPAVNDNFDIVLEWTLDASLASSAVLSYRITDGSSPVRGGEYGGDDAAGPAVVPTGAEEVRWPYGGPPPDAAAYRVCVRRRGTAMVPGLMLYNVTLGVYDSGALVTSVSRDVRPIMVNASCSEQTPGWLGTAARTASSPTSSAHAARACTSTNSNAEPEAASPVPTAAVSRTSAPGLTAPTARLVPGVTPATAAQPYAGRQAALRVPSFALARQPSASASAATASQTRSVAAASAAFLLAHPLPRPSRAQPSKAPAPPSPTVALGQPTAATPNSLPRVTATAADKALASTTASQPNVVDASYPGVSAPLTLAPAPALSTSTDAAAARSASAVGARSPSPACSAQPETTASTPTASPLSPPVNGPITAPVETDALPGSTPASVGGIRASACSSTAGGNAAAGTRPASPAYSAKPATPPPPPPATPPVSPAVTYLATADPGTNSSPPVLPTKTPEGPTSASSAPARERDRPRHQSRPATATRSADAAQTAASPPTSQASADASSAWALSWPFPGTHDLPRLRPTASGGPGAAITPLALSASSSAQAPAAPPSSTSAQARRTPASASQSLICAHHSRPCSVETPLMMQSFARPSHAMIHTMGDETEA
ncbi:hypothetical protein HYH03_001449 [Edaphochlamys debaryana]|uniref:Ricin B lectin domain-containing protein n=1 Tax=Edaphochlamys debaryana TaxID=47281 RepID=A0A836C625_9CHLO|nr:hypothetical protein HYH03_001449 [Edaphochlamys debaryana]|eukprot:KAG2500683.1 hypothetical protein HYH03_001449 [Edaphochlamys debaryana]